MKFSLLSLVTLLLLGCIAPVSNKQNFAGRYNAELPAGEKEVRTTYTHVTSRTSEGGYVVRRFFPETRTLTRVTRYKDADLAIPHGDFRSYFDDGTPRQIGQYTNGLKTGEWSTYSLREKGALSGRGTYQAGEKDGEWLTYHKDGGIRSRATFEAGEEIGVTIRYDTLGQVLPGGEEALRQLPLFPGCEELDTYEKRKPCADRKMLEYIYRNVRYPARARAYDVEGMAIISFVVEKDGSIADILVLDGITQDITDEITRIVREMPFKWQPGTVDGEPVRVQFNLPIKFKLV